MGLRVPAGGARAVASVRPSRRVGAARLTGLPQAICLALADVLSALIAYALASLVLTALGRSGLPLESLLIWLGLWVLWRAYQGLYPGYGRSPQTELRLHTTGTIQIAVGQLAAAFAVDRWAPGTLGVVLVWALILVLSLLLRYAVRALLIRAGQFGRSISVIGAGRTGSLIIGHLCAHPSYGLNPVAAYDDDRSLHGTALHGVPVLGPIEQALTQPLTEQALLSIPGARAETQRHLVNSVYGSFAITWVIPDLFGVPNQALLPHSIGNVASLEIRNNLRSVQARVLKRSIDLLGAVLGGLLISPLLLLIALAIRLDTPGPAVYRARRLGRGGQMFDCFKFRSMYRDADEKLKHVLEDDPALRAEFEATHKLKSDPRVTRVGAFLRKTSLDELPQLANVLLGTMSLVGPRPIVQAEVEKYGAVYDTYKLIRPGMTGYWQANGRSDTSYADRVAMDRFYITNWTPWLDMVIMIQTVRVVVMGKGAY
ncbi:undecaprenyl-phosphate galactose phosphotransferase WbaP [Deinococcus sp. SDU3-2]|uniref:Undecaprenyl-phosphate galactose phosphotransferase WbaP n=1 Tax=Deinococcus terrestris TaxID=2651870 RepID=A0A7X1NXG9_9DEIO|nr:undecaprenyl-phosphate galactose phosphotransferase WbaP [Deinococcus terrestris]MPY67635.1 undecaprenyl-phosphate galactose phosphotransferase WbaP [Deinococcus terrestris]